MEKRVVVIGNGMVGQRLVDELLNRGSDPASGAAVALTVSAIDREARQVGLVDGTTVAYDHLVLASLVGGQVTGGVLIGDLSNYDAPTTQNTR